MNPQLAAAPSTGHEALIGRIVSSQAFRRAARLRELLRYIGAHSGHPEELSEQQIGISVFGRAAGYNPADDNIVRASARQLRAKLREYFESEGLLEPVILEIPKGGYAPRFHERLADAPVSPARRPTYLWMFLTGALAVSTLALAIDRVLSRPAPAEPDSVLHQFLKQVEGPVRFVLTDSALAAMNSWRDETVDVDAYGSRSFLEEGARGFAGNPDMIQAWNDIGKRQITSLADVGVLSKLLQFYPSSAGRIEVRHARHMLTRDFKTGNAIITGSVWSNPWAALFDSGLNFQFERHRIVNLKPAPGEAAAYEVHDRTHWSRIALVHNLSANGWVLLIAGLGFEGTEGAGEFLLRPESVAEVRRVLGTAPSDPLPSFELVLETTATEGTAYSPRIDAWRRH